MQKRLNLPGRQRKEGLMIRELAQIVFRQVCAPSERILERPNLPPARCPIIEQPPCSSSGFSTDTTETRSMAAAGAGRWSEEQTLALVVLFAQLAQRHVQPVRAH